MKILLLFLVAIVAALAQPPPANLVINQSNVQGGTPADCLIVNSSRRLGQQACGTGSGTVTSVSGTANQISVTTGTTTAVVGFTATPIMPNGTTATAQSAGDATSKLANDAFVAAVIASINPAISVQAATIAVLSNTPTYANGTAGVGATLTGGSVGALSIDGYTVLLGDRVLVKNQASTFQNGVYTETTVGTGGVAYVLTRATDYNAPSNINYTGTIPVLNGSTLNGTGWNGPTNIATVGTDALTYTQASSGSGPAGGNVKATGNLANFTFIEGANGKTIQSVTSPNCADTVGQHLNFNSSTGAISCGVSVPANTTITIASGAKALATGAISSAACTSAQTDTATGTATTDVIIATFNGDPTGVTGYVPLTTGMLTIIPYPSSNTVNFKVCNNTASSITPGAITINWKVVR